MKFTVIGITLVNSEGAGSRRFLTEGESHLAIIMA